MKTINGIYQIKEVHGSKPDFNSSPLAAGGAGWNPACARWPDPFQINFLPPYI